MQALESLLTKNTQWAEKIKSEEPALFEELVRNQKPEILWLGCSDSRVPATYPCSLG